MLLAWARFVSVHKWWVVVAWAAIAAGILVAGARWGGELGDRFEIPDSESDRAISLLQQHNPVESYGSATMVFAPNKGAVTELGTRNRIEAALTQIEAIPGVLAVVSPFENPTLISPNGEVALATVRFSTVAQEMDYATVDRLFVAAENARSDNLRVELTGGPVRHREREGPGESERIGLIAAAIVLFLVFGSVVAMGLPIVTALVGLACGLSLVTVVAAFTDVATMAPSFASMLGIGVGIDYALFLVTRYRESIASGATVQRAIEVTITTAGRSVAFAGIVVVVALLGLFAVGIPFVANMGLAAAIVVTLALLIALTLLPALLAIAGRRVEFLAIRHPAVRPEDVPRMPLYRFSVLVQRFPVIALLLSLGILGTMAYPLLDVQLGMSDEGNYSRSTTSRRAYDLTSEAFGPGFNGTLFVVLERPGSFSPGTLVRLRKAIANHPGVAAVGRPRLNEAGDTAVITIVPRTRPQDQATRNLVNELRADVFPGILARSDPSAVAYLTGSTAAYIDVSQRMEDRLPPFFSVVVGISFLLLVVAFRSIVVPLKAAILNFVAIAAGMGATVAVFQWGWGIRYVGLEQPGPIESFLPMFIFAILFGLSMDYEVFLISRIRERFLETGDHDESIAFGVAASGRVISAAAAILVVVFLSFVLSPERSVKEFGLTLAVSVLIDATLVRLVVVPATMQLMGAANWWLPAWLDNLLPWLELEGRPEEEPRDFTAPQGAAHLQPQTE